MVRYPDGMEDSELKARVEWIDKVRSLNKRKRFAGYIGCIVGIFILAWGRFGIDAPSWAIPLGLAVVAVSWLIFIYVVYDRWRWMKNNPFHT